MPAEFRVRKYKIQAQRIILDYSLRLGNRCANGGVIYHGLNPISGLICFNHNLSIQGTSTRFLHL